MPIVTKWFREVGDYVRDSVEQDTMEIIMLKMLSNKPLINDVNYKKKQFLFSFLFRNLTNMNVKFYK